VPDPAQTTLTKAKLTILEPKDGGNPAERDVITFPFNPKDWTLTRSAEWKVETEKNKVAPAEFKGPKPAQITVELFLDASDKDDGDISATVAKLMKCVVPDAQSTQQKKPSAPHVRFEWGTAIAFKGYVETVAVKYTLFRPSGAPVRGTATLTIKEMPDSVGSQNPTSGGVAGNRSHQMVAGDTLASVAYAEYGQPAKWRLLADANPSIDDPMRIAPGTTILVPPG